MNSQESNHNLSIMEGDYQRIKSAFALRTISSFSDDQLVDALQVLGANRTGDDSMYVQDGIQAMSINHLLQQRTILGIERRSLWSANIVIILAVVSVMASAVQIWLSLQHP